MFDHLGLPEVTEEEIEAATYAHGTKDIPHRNVVEDIKGATDILNRGVTGLDIVKGLAKNNFTDAAESVLNQLKQRTTGDFLQTASVFDENWNVISAVNTPNDYAGPGTGYRLDGEEWERVKDIRQAIDPRDV